MSTINAKSIFLKDIYTVDCYEDFVEGMRPELAEYYKYLTFPCVALLYQDNENFYIIPFNRQELEYYKQCIDSHKEIKNAME